MIYLTNLINGKHAPPASAQYLDNVDPATGAVYSKVPDSDSRDVDLAVKAAQGAFPAWASTPAAERSRILLAIAQGIEDRVDTLAHAECIDTGKPLRLARTVDI